MMSTQPDRRPRRRAGIVGALLAAVLIAAFLVPDRFPDLFGLALPFEAVLPWFGILAVVLLIRGLVRRAWLGTLVSLAAIAAWSFVFVPRILPLQSPGNDADAASITVLSQNLHGAEGDPDETARAALEQDADLIAFQEVDADSRAPVDEILDAAYPYSIRTGTITLWSRFPLSDPEPLDLGLGWKRALRVTVEHPDGPIRVYAVHAASARIQAHEERDRMLAELADTVGEDGTPRIIALGDFNAGSDDRALAPLADLLVEPRQTSGGFGFTWPEQFPVVRLDHVFEHGFDPRSSSTLRLGESDHLAVLAVLQPTG